MEAVAMNMSQLNVAEEPNTSKKLKQPFGEMTLKECCSGMGGVVWLIYSSAANLSSSVAVVLL